MNRHTSHTDDECQNGLHQDEEIRRSAGPTEVEVLERKVGSLTQKYDPKLPVRC